MNKKGFTLVELTAVIMLLGIIILLIVPNVTNLMKDAKEKSHDKQIDGIIVASKKYTSEHDNLLPDIGSNSRLVITIDDLIENGVITSDRVIDPSTDEDLEGCVIVTYNNNYNQYIYTYSLECE